MVSIEFSKNRITYIKETQISNNRCINNIHI